MTSRVLEKWVPLGRKVSDAAYRFDGRERGQDVT